VRLKNHPEPSLRKRVRLSLLRKEKEKKHKIGLMVPNKNLEEKKLIIILH